jgi:hypothetical protein
MEKHKDSELDTLQRLSSFVSSRVVECCMGYPYPYVSQLLSKRSDVLPALGFSESACMKTVASFVA